MHAQLCHHVGRTRDGTEAAPTIDITYRTAMQYCIDHTTHTIPKSIAQQSTGSDVQHQQKQHTGEDASIEDVEGHDGAPRLRDSGGETRVVVKAEVMLKPHHRGRGRGRAPVPHGGGGIGGDDPALASVPQDPTAVGRGWEKQTEPEREQSHGMC